MGSREDHEDNDTFYASKYSSILYLARLQKNLSHALPHLAGRVRLVIQNYRPLFHTNNNSSFFYPGDVS